MNIEFELWENENGKCYVGDFIKEQGGEVAIKIEISLAEFQKISFMQLLRFEKIKKLKGDIYEIRLKINGLQYRLLFLKKEDKGFLVEAFIKKVQKTPLKFIKTAENRAKEIQ